MLNAVLRDTTKERASLPNHTISSQTPVVPYRFFSRAWPWERVIDIGSGDNPHPRAGVLVDCSWTNEDRWGSLKLDRGLVIADAHTLPFRDGSFDVAICSHCLEHCQDPELVATEIARVARRGVVEVSTPYLDILLQPYDRHLWIFARRGSSLLYAPAPLVEVPLATKTHTAMLLRSNFLFRSAYLLDESTFRVRYYWDGRLHLRRVSTEEVLSHIPESPVLMSLQSLRLMLWR